MKGLLISLEGGDGAGKSFQCKLLTDYIRGEHREAVIVREPGGTFISEQLRGILLSTSNSSMCDETEALLYAAARAQLVNEIIRPALSDGRIVICERFTDSSFVYQGFARGLRMCDIQNINSFATGGLTPDITFFLDIPPDDALARKRLNAELDRIELEKFDFHKKVYDGYRELARDNPNRIIVIDAATSPDEIHRRIVSRLSVMLYAANDFEQGTKKWRNN